MTPEINDWYFFGAAVATMAGALFGYDRWRPRKEGQERKELYERVEKGMFQRIDDLAEQVEGFMKMITDHEGRIENLVGRFEERRDQRERRDRSGGD